MLKTENESQEENQGVETPAYARDSMLLQRRDNQDTGLANGASGNPALEMQVPAPPGLPRKTAGCRKTDQETPRR